MSAAFGARLGWGAHPAVVAIDLCQAYVTPGSPLYAGCEDAVEAAARVISAARSAGIPVLHTRVRYSEGGLDGGVFFRKVKALSAFVGDTELGAFCPSCLPADGEVVVTKQYASAFFGTSLAPTLRSLGVDTVVLIGLSTSGCVRASGVDAVQHGFIPIVVAEACGDRDARPHDAALFDLDAKYADVVSLSDALRHLESL